MINRLAVLAGVLALLFVGVSARAAEKLDKDSAHFLTHAYLHNWGDVDIGKIGLQRASSTEVKDLAGHVVDAHGKIVDQIKGLASKFDVTLPSKLGHWDTTEVARLDKLSGADFDKAFLDFLATDHKNAVAMFDRESKMGTNADIKAFAATTLPGLEGHLKMINDLQARVARGEVGNKGGTSSEVKYPSEEKSMEHNY